LVPFLTPFGTPVTAAFLHSIMYWVMMIGVCNFMTLSVAGEIQKGTWNLLRMTPYSIREILLIKSTAVTRLWHDVLRVLILTRIIATITIPISIAIEAHNALALDAISAGLFILQPLVDGALMISVSILASLLIGNVTLARFSSYAAAAIIYGALNGLSGMWLIFTSPIGPLAGLLVPLGHWTLFVTTMVPMKSIELQGLQVLILVGLHIVIPLLLTIGLFKWSERIAAKMA
jgi:hypothetical protein